MSATDDAENAHAIETATERAVTYAEAAAASEPAEGLPDELRQVDVYLSDAQTYLNGLREEQIRLLVLLSDMDVATHFEEMDPDYAPRGRTISTAVAVAINAAMGSVLDARERLLKLRPLPSNVVPLAGGAS